MVHKTFYYARVSTREQNLDRQLETFRALGADDREIITDKESGKTLTVPATGAQVYYAALRRYACHKVARPAQPRKADIHSELQWFKQNNIHLKVIDLPTTMMDLPPGQEWVFEMVNNILIEVLGTIAEQERLTIHQRQREGINAAKAKGKHLGRPSTSLPDNWDQVLALWQSGEITAREAMRRTGMKRTTFYQLVRKSS